MRFEWQYEGPPLKLAAFLKQQGFSRAQLKKLRYQGGFILLINGSGIQLIRCETAIGFWFKPHLSKPPLVLSHMNMSFRSVMKTMITWSLISLLGWHRFQQLAGEMTAWPIWSRRI